MLEFDEATRRALSQRYGPTPDAQARVLTELRSTLSGPMGPDGGGGEAAPPTVGSSGGVGQAVWIAKICAATAGLTGAGLLVLKLGASVLADADEREATEMPAKVETPAPARTPTSPPAAPEPPAERAASSPAEVPTQTPTKRRSSPAGSTLAAELALLDAAERIRNSDPESALARLDQHRREFPTGALAPEREALRLEVLCSLGRAPAASCGGTGSNKSGD
jgi:hypothetical protein